MYLDKKENILFENKKYSIVILFENKKYSIVHLKEKINNQIKNSIYIITDKFFTDKVIIYEFFNDIDGYTHLYGTNKEYPQYIINKLNSIVKEGF